GTLPSGEGLVPAAWVSVTVTVQVLAWFTKTELGTHDTEVEVERRLTAVTTVPDVLFAEVGSAVALEALAVFAIEPLPRCATVPTILMFTAAPAASVPITTGLL